HRDPLKRPGQGPVAVAARVLPGAVGPVLARPRTPSPRHLAALGAADSFFCQSGRSLPQQVMTPSAGLRRHPDSKDGPLSPLALIPRRLSLRARLAVLPLLAFATLTLAPAGAQAASSYNAEICGNNAAAGQMSTWRGWVGSSGAVVPCLLATPTSGTEPAGYSANTIYTAPANEAITAVYWGGSHYWSATAGAHGWSSGMA